VSGPRIWDTFMVRDELPMLQMRLEELDGIAWRHILVEATVDHQGHPKPLWYAENREQFAPWHDRIIHVVVDDLPDSPNPWVREHAQRDRALPALVEADMFDPVLIADIDEIPAREALVAEPRPVLAFEQEVHPFAVDWLAFSERTSALATAGSVRGRGLAATRDARASYPVVRNAGFHFCWLGGKERCLQKLDAFCHLEAREIVRQGIESGDFIERGLWNVARLQPVDIDERWPKMIRERRCPPEWFRSQEAT
jgi:hypothetical protein